MMSSHTMVTAMDTMVTYYGNSHGCDVVIILLRAEAIVDVHSYEQLGMGVNLYTL